MTLSKIQRDIVSSLTGRTVFQFEPASLEGSAYPLDLEPILDDESLFFGLRDANGLPIARFPSFGDIYVPTRIAAYALSHYNRFLLHSNEESRAEFIKAANWFMESEDALWYYSNDYGELKAPWISGMAQGEAMSVLVRAYSLTGEEKYLLQAIKALTPLTRYFDEGGVRSRIDGEHEFIEEYPFEKPHHTLNGFMYCLIGLLDLAKTAPQSVSEVGLDDICDTLISQVSRWDIGYWTIYDLHKTDSGRRNAATMTYHRLHTTQLQYLAAKLDSDELRTTADRWARYCNSGINRVRALGAKILYRLNNPHVSR